ncbi:uncharacterized protein HMPREF1541_06176 [Cyphellophora europaea CBS 101466]|uniref:Aconitase/3-isopropylmalate dehydratase large subunit alpha/beta/alpha domain-containing protein n=1 Tax=Cyphellophora europaea (strain CBS 101466) TaxID=1220924 RepID=W2RW92_CYPE1|nr:uncharacterized protein HMPREF1541_06176 [Cyphellophora europaea CBS 101466]ETN39949.1 hypothetical protein HMPREF1541_06176 [Cyphellophora europaea CBS 101466]
MPGIVELPAEAVGASSPEEFTHAITALLQVTRGLNDDVLKQVAQSVNSTTKPFIPFTLTTIIDTLRPMNPSEADALALALEKTIDSPSHGGLGITQSTTPDSTHYEDVLFLLSAHLTALNNAQLSFNATITHPLPTTQPMNLTQKIFALHSLSPLPLSGLHTGAVVRAGLDWVLASELSWSAMARTHTELGSPGIWRNDRFWLAGDHVVHPLARGNARVEAMVSTAEKAKRQFRMTDYQGMNYTIMHTEFVRERAEPGMLCVGSDSHTCSGGAMGCLSIGLGAADVMMALALGQTWFKIPEVVRIEFVGRPGRGVSGKDVILHILRQLKRNTVASERIVEFVGEGCRYLSVDARFAICNMCTEFGAVTGLFVPDEVTKRYVAKRRRKANRKNSVYMKPDEGAEYSGEYTIDLGKVEHTIAVYPEPDHVVPVSEKAGMKIDGVFIGACTTTEEEIVLAALVLKVGLKKGLPLAKGKRHYVPGSLPIVDKLSQLNLLQVYEQAGFTRGPPGCSYCVGLSAEKASEGETWLSSQNRNFKNRMGPGAFGNLSSAVVCAASSFSLTIADPAPFLAELDFDWFDNIYRQAASPPPSPSPSPQQQQQLTYMEPDLHAPTARAASTGTQLSKPSTVPEPMGTMRSTIITLGDMIDTDALAPGHTLVNCETDAEFGAHCLEHTHPEFRGTVRSYAGSTAVVVAGWAFGVGSSRENAVSALKGCGVVCVISRSFAFILGRNLPSLGLLGFTMEDEGFFAAAQDGRAIEVDVPRRMVRVEIEEGEWREWGFVLSEMEYQLTLNEGVTKSFQRYGKGVWEGLMKADGGGEEQTLDEAAMLKEATGDGPKGKLEW